MASGGIGRGRGIGRGIGRSAVSTLASQSASSTSSAPDVTVTSRRRNFGVSASILENYLSLDGGKVDLYVEPGLTRGMGLDNKKIKTEDEAKADVKNLRLGTAYAEKAVEREKQEALAFHADNPVPMEVVSCEGLPGSSMDLDGVSTTMGELNNPQDPDWMNKLEQYFNEARRETITLQPLPIANYRDKVVTAVKVNRVTIIEGPTGCGKTTQVPQYIADECFRMKQYFNIVVTQPRRIAAITVAKRVCAERTWDLGGLVGYQVGLEKSISENTKILYCTTGVLLQKLIHQKRMDMFTHIIIDEVHERDADTDLLLMIVRKFLWTHNAPVKVIIMSATFDTDELKKYFVIPNPRSIVTNTIAPVSVTVAEKPHKLTSFYITQLNTLCHNQGRLPNFDLTKPHISNEVFDIAVTLVSQLDSMEQHSKKGAVLIFLPGLDEINEMISRLRRDASRHYYLLPLHSSINIDEQRRVFEPANLGERKVIVATNIAESSITVPDIMYVIDFCLTKSLICDPDTNYPTLRLEWASKANCDQRAGRAGRVEVGRVYRMVTSDFFSQLPPYPTPEILRTPLETSVLRVKMLRCGPPKDLLGLCVSPPDLSDIKNAVLRLKHSGALTTMINGNYDREDGEITAIGEIMAALPIDVQLSRLILLGYAFGCFDECIVIASCLTIMNMFSRPYGKEILAYKSKLAWADRTFSDLMSYLHAFDMYRDFQNAGLFEHGQNAKKWCEQNYIQLKRMKEVEILYKELKHRLEDVHITDPERPNKETINQEDDLILKVVMCGAFYPNYFLRMDMEMSDIRRDLNDKDPCTTVKISNLPANEGVLYVNGIRDLFKECSDQIDVEFEETHALLTFSSDKNPLAEAQKMQYFLMGNHEIERVSKRKYRDTAVKTSVYVAIKMRQIGMPLFLRVYKPDHARQKLEQLRQARDEQVDERKRLRTNRFSVPAIIGSKLKQITLPPIGTRSVTLFVTEVLDCGHFWAQYYCDETKERLNKLRTYNNDFPQLKPLMRVNPGMIALSAWNKNERVEYCRARVESVDEERGQIRVFYIDFGNTDIKNSPSELLEVPPDSKILKIPALAFECKLANLKPMECRTYDGSWLDAAKNHFVGLVSNCKNLKGEVYSVVNRVVRLRLSKTLEDGRIIDVNEELIRRGFAEKADESVQSIQDHMQRMNSTPVEGAETSDQYYPSESSIEVFVPTDVNESCYSSQRIKIRGPYSPIEANFQGITRLNYRLKVNIERESVNSVCLQHDPDASQNRLLVAAHVGLSGHTGRIIARNTTLMPNIKGFASIMALLFCPTCELRLDDELTRYTGAICGLGYEPGKASYDRDNDIEIAFDVILTPADMGKINIIRLQLNDLFSTTTRLSETTGRGLFMRRQTLRQRLLSLLERKRASQTPSNRARNDFRWGVLDPRILEEPTNIYAETYHQFLKLHKMPNCVEDDKWAEVVRDNVDLLKGMLEANLNHKAHCKACDVNIYTPLDLANHLKSEEHTAKVHDILAHEDDEIAGSSEQFVDYEVN